MFGSILQGGEPREVADLYEKVGRRFLNDGPNAGLGKVLDEIAALRREVKLLREEVSILRSDIKNVDGK